LVDDVALATAWNTARRACSTIEFTSISVLIEVSAYLMSELLVAKIAID
jgi:hypothetical protein